MDELDLGATIRGFVAGQKVFNRYTLIKQLGRGGMGVVWRARDESLEQDVAIKMLPEIVANDPASVRELKRETSRNQQLSHPHILRVFDFVESGALCGITMEVAEGGTLAHRRLDQPHEHFEVADIREWVRQLCEALDYAHRRAKVVHRDLKPANLMLTKEGELKVTDFGIAASLSESVTRVSKQGSSSGTPLYMSPQQMMGDKPAVTDDLYALGATLYELLTGKPPFYAGNVILQVQNKVALPMTQRRQDLEIDGAAIPAEWEETIAACLAKEPASRPQTAREVAERLGLVEAAVRVASAKSLAADNPVPTAAAAPGTAPSQAGARAEPRRRGRLFALIGVAAAALLVSAWLLIVVLPERRRREAEVAQQQAVTAAQEKAAEAEYQEMKRAVARLSPESTESEMQALSERVGSYTNYGALATPRHREIDAEWGQRYAAWDVADKRRKEEAADAEQKRLSQEKADREAAEQRRLAQEKAERAAKEVAERKAAEAAAQRAREQTEHAASAERDRAALALAREALKFTDEFLRPWLQREENLKSAKKSGGIMGAIMSGVVQGTSPSQTAQQKQALAALERDAQSLRRAFGEGGMDLAVLPEGTPGRTADQAMTIVYRAVALAYLETGSRDRELIALDAVGREVAGFQRMTSAARQERMLELARANQRLQSGLPSLPATAANHSPPVDATWSLLPGVEVQVLNEALRAEHRLPESATGLVVVRVDDRDPTISLRVGGLIEQINRQAVSSIDAATAALQPGRNLLLVLYEGSYRYVPVAVSEAGVTSEANLSRAVTYNAARGETLRRLAELFGVSVEAIAQANGWEAQPDYVPRGLMKIPQRTSDAFTVPRVAATRIQISVQGAVNSPGRLSLAEGSNLGQALAAAGGISRVGNAKAITVNRPGPDGSRVYSVDTQADPQGPVLEDGDIIFVPERLF